MVGCGTLYLEKYLFAIAAIVVKDDAPKTIGNSVQGLFE